MFFCPGSGGRKPWPGLDPRMEALLRCEPRLLDSWPGIGGVVRTASGQVGPALPLPAVPPPPLLAASDASRAPPPAAPPAQDPPVKAKPRGPRRRLLPPPPPPVAKGTWGQNWGEIDPEDDEEARKRETAPIEVVFGAE